ncbi:MAG: hypothetical protein NTW87_07205 [Planctomycetota bacterium]|nr:hypothetical protein [Planctomycetota bacterium]
MRGEDNAAAPGRNVWADYRFAPDAIAEIDLASDIDWKLSEDGGAPRPIKVTAGGWNSDQQSPPIPSADVKDCATYERAIAIPAEAEGRVVKVLFGGCNYGAEVLLDGVKVAEHHAPMTPFEADLTGVAQAGKMQALRVKAYSRYHYGNPPTVTAGFDFNKGISKQYEGHTKYAYGLTGHVRLAIYPAIYISDVFVQPSVAGKALSYEVWLANSTKSAGKVTLKGALSPWNKQDWNYPAIADREVELAAGQTLKVSLENVPWTLGPESYWWPNIPFREDYRAILHSLKLTLEQEGKVVHQRQQRFGFVEYKEGPYYYTVNGVRITSFSELRPGWRIRLLDRDAVFSAAARSVQRLPRNVEALSAGRLQQHAALHQRADPVHAGDGRRGGLHAGARRRFLGQRHLPVRQDQLFLADSGDNPGLPQSSLRIPLFAGERIVAGGLSKPKQSLALAD